MCSLLSFPSCLACPGVCAVQAPARLRRRWQRKVRSLPTPRPPCLTTCCCGWVPAVAVCVLRDLRVPLWQRSLGSSGQPALSPKMLLRAGCSPACCACCAAYCLQVWRFHGPCAHPQALKQKQGDTSDETPRLPADCLSANHVFSPAGLQAGE